MADRKLISIVVPVFNEAGNIHPFYDAVMVVLRQLSERYDYEFVFTDNHSEDSTFAELRELHETDPRVRVFRFSRNFGFQRSILTGYRRCRGDAAIQLDCDLQDPPELILEFVRHWEAGCRVVYGVRKKRQEGALVTLARKVFYRLINLLSEDPLPLDAGDFRLLDRRVLVHLTRLRDDKPYLRGTLATLGFEQKGVPYVRAARTHGESKFSFRDLMALALDGILSHSTVPLRIATYTGLVVSSVTFGGLVFYSVAAIFWDVSWPAGFATTTILILLSLSLNSLFLGIIGEYLGRIFHQVRGRPTSIVELSLDAETTRDAACGVDTDGTPGDAEHVETATTT